ncbi:MAG: hypothetical protein EXR77_19795, partial [Myxococcales bacterium]|nr:hypothetical protein [Myxococcales bacterium]
VKCAADADCGLGNACVGYACKAGKAAVCGNKAIEVGETCDDGNGADGDGCSGKCLAETPPLGGLIDAAMAYDAATGIGWIVGGELAYQLNDAVVRYSEDGKLAPFTPFAGLVGPPARARASLVRDPKSGHALLFGGEGYYQVFNDVWRLVPNNPGAPSWQAVATKGPQPGERMGAVAFWHAGSGRMVVGLGEGYYKLPEDWWALDPVAKTWKLLTLPPLGGPLPRKAAAVADDGTGGAWIYGGQGYYEVFADLWHVTVVGDAVKFAQVQLAPTAPLPLTRGCLVQTAKGLVLAGGETFYRLSDEVFRIDPGSGKWTTGKGPVTAGPVCSLRADGNVVVQLGQGYYQWTQAPGLVAP